MFKARRLLFVVGTLALTAIITSSLSRGDDPKKTQRSVATAGQTRLSAAPAPAVESALAESRFAEGVTLLYEPLEGDPVFALQVKLDLKQAKPELKAVPQRLRDLVILVSTSATQAGPSWVASRQIVETLIKQARAGDRVSLWTVSTPEFTKCLTNNLVNAREDAKTIDSALASLNKVQYPAGDTDLKSALAKAVQSFDDDSRQRVIVFLGDGLSTHNPITNEERQAICQEMTAKRIVFFAVPLGMQLEPENLHGFATGTGGLVVRIKLGEDELKDVVQRCHDAFAAPVLYPTSVKMSAEVTEFYPQQLPPLRSDVATLVIGKMKPAKTIGCTIQGTVPGQGAVTLTQNEDTAKADLDNYFLLSMVRQWQKARSQPALIRADRALAIAYEQTRLNRVERLTAAQVAINQDRFDDAVRLFEETRELNPRDADAKAGIAVVRRLKDGSLTRDDIKRQLETDRQGVKINKVNGALQVQPGQWTQLALLEQEQPAKPGAAQRDDLLQAHRDQMLVEEQKMTQTVATNLRQAKSEMAGNPTAALELLRNTLLRVREHPDLSDRVRTALVDQLQSALGQSAVQARAIELSKREKQQIVEATQREQELGRQRLTAEERIEAQFQAYKSLMLVARVEEKVRQEVIAGLLGMRDEARLKNEPVPVVVPAAYDQTQAVYHLRKMEELKRLKEERVMQTLLEVEKSHMPFPDEPGIYFPPLATWQALSKLRKEKYEYSALPDDDHGRAEATSISKILNEVLETKDFQQPMKLREFLMLLTERMSARQKTVEFWVDKKAFLEETPEAEDPLETDVKFDPIPKKMSLATALRYALSQIKTDNATYLIRRNFIEITTNLRQTRERVLRVYPVGDLVIPITQQIGGAAGQFGLQGGIGFGGFNVGGIQGGGFNLGGIGGIQGGGFNLGGIGGFNIGGFGGFNVGQIQGGAIGVGISGGFGFGNFQGGAFQGGFNGALGMLGASQAVTLIDLITKVVAPGEWFLTQQALPFQPQFNFVGGGGLFGQQGGPIGGQAIGAPPPPPQAQGGPANIQDANTIEFFPPALALIIRAPTRLHTTTLGGTIGGKNKRIEAAMLDDPNERNLEKVGPGRPGGGGNEIRVAGARGKRPASPDFDPRVIWEEALAKAQIQPGLVIATADLLFEHGHFAHAAEFLKANLRQGIVVRPWVFEALAIALEASRGDAHEINRARLSAVALDPTDATGFVKAAQTMARHKQYDRALAFCRQAALLEPNLVHTYADALAYAELGKDSQAMQWAVSRLMGQDWPVDNHALQAKAESKLNALVRTLEQENRRSDSERLQTALQTLRHRDLAIHLTWENPSDREPADVGMSIKEPTGTTCTAFQRQTPGGGTMIVNSLTAKDTRDMTRVTYVAAQAFSGEYEITVHRNFGQPLNGRAYLDIIQHDGTSKKLMRREVIQLSQSQPVKLVLSEGRRTSLAVVPPPEAQQAPLQAADERGGGNMTILAKVRRLAHPDFAGANFAGAAGTPGAKLSALVDTSERRRPDTGQVTYQGAINSGTGLNYNAQAVLEGNQVRLRLNPVFQTLQSGSRPAGNLSLIPGAGN